MYYPPNNQPHYQPPYQPYQPPYYNPFWKEKCELRKTSCGLGWALLVMLVSMIFLAFLGSFFLKVIGYQAVDIEGFNGYTPVLYFLNIGLSYVVGLFVTFTGYLAIKRLRFSEVLPFQHVSALNAIACVCFGVAVCMLANIPAGIVTNIIKSFGFSGTMPSYGKTDNLYANILYAVCTMVIPPLTEEFVFRGVILNRLRKYGDGFAILGSALLFGIFHGNFIQLPFAFIVGLVLAFIVVRTGNLWITIIIHVINNSFSIAIEFLQRYHGENFATHISNWGFLAFVVIGLVALIVLIKNNQEFFKIKKPATYMPLSTKFGAMMLNAGTIFFTLFCLYEAIMNLTRT